MGSPQASSSSSTAAARNAETRAINSSLHVLTRVVAAYAGAGSSSSKRPVHVPFRESLLTLLLKDSIGGNSRTAIVVTMNAEDPTQSYRTKAPLRVIGEVENWEGHSPEVLAQMLDHLAQLREQGLDVIED